TYRDNAAYGHFTAGVMSVAQASAGIGSCADAYGATIKTMNPTNPKQIRPRQPDERAITLPRILAVLARRYTYTLAKCSRKVGGTAEADIGSYILDTHFRF